jgi:hypothetical protein
MDELSKMRSQAETDRVCASSTVTLDACLAALQCIQAAREALSYPYPRRELLRRRSGKSLRSAAYAAALADSLTDPATGLPLGWGDSSR